jgi:superfamily II DNA/RNA helicase
MAPPIKKLADRFLKEPRMIEVARQSSTNANIAQSLLMTGPREKREALRGLLAAEDVTSAIVFCNRKRDVKDLADSLKRYGFRAGQIHGDMEQRDRLSTLEDFKADRISILVASDVAARGLDIKGVSHVFNFDVPFNAEDYVHRIGRTGRAGKTGIAVTLVTPADAELIADIEKLIGTRVERRGTVPQQDGGGAKSADKGADRDADASRDADKDARPAGGRARGGKRARGGDRKPEAPRADPAPKAGPRPAREEEFDDGGWNGPLPDFLSVSARG